MALTYDDLTSKTNKFIVPRMVDEVYKSSPLFTRLRTRNMERFEGGQTIRHPIMYAKLKGGAFTRGGSFDTSYVQTDTALEVLVKYYYVNVTLYGVDNVLNRGAEAAMSLVESKMVNASARMADLLGTDLFSTARARTRPRCSSTACRHRSTTARTSCLTAAFCERTLRPATTLASTPTTRT